jgi:uncharacterized protein
MAGMSPSARPLLLGAALAALCLGAAPSRAAPFDCARLSTVTEAAICADPTLSRFDRDVAAAYADILKDFQLASEARKSPAVAALEAGQHAWLAERARCAGDTACLGLVYRRRLAVLASRPDPGEASPIDGFIGAFAVEHTPSNADLAITLFKAEGDTALVEIAATGPAIACSVVGVGRLDEAGRLTVQIAHGKVAHGKPAAGPLLLTQSASGVRIEPGAAASAACGKQGDLAQDYARLDPQAVAAAAAIATSHPDGAGSEALSLTRAPAANSP